MQLASETPSKVTPLRRLAGLPEPEYESAKATAARFGIPEATLSTLRCRGGGPRYSKVNGKVLYSREDVRAWLEAGARLSTSAPDQPTAA